MTEQRTDAYTKLAEASPFWAGALTSCIDQGLDEQATRELLEKCAQADSILEEELTDVAAHFKQADWWTPFENAKRFIGGLGTTAAAGLGTAGAGLGALGEGAYNMATGRKENYSKDVMNDMVDYVHAGGKDMGTSLGMRGLDATADGSWNNEAVKQTRILHEAKMDATNMTEAEKATARGFYDFGEGAAETAATLAVPGTVFKGLGQGVKAFQGARGAGALGRIAAGGRGLGQGTLTGVRSYAPVLAGGAPVFGSGSMTAARAGFLNAPTFTGATTLPGRAVQGVGNIFGTANRFGARNLLAPMAGAGVANAAGPGGTLYGTTGAPQILSFIPGVGRTALAGGGRMLPSGVALGGFEVGDQLIGKGGEMLYQKYNPGHTISPSQFSDETGFSAYAAMPRKNRPLLPDANYQGGQSEIKLPGAEIWTDAIKEGADPGEAFAASLYEFQRNGGAKPVEQNVGTYSMRSRSLANILPQGDKLKQLYPDQSPPEIPLGDPAAAQDFTIPLDGIVAHQVGQLHSQQMQQLLTNGLISKEQAAAAHAAFMQAPDPQAIATVRGQYLDALKERLDPIQHQSLLDAYKGRGGGTTVPEVHIPPPAAPTPQPPQRATNPRVPNLASPVFGR